MSFLVRRTLTKWPFALSTLTLYSVPPSRLARFFPFFFFSFFFLPLVLLLRSARRVLAQEENRPRHAISKKLRNSHASTAFPRGKKKGKKGEKKITPSWAS